ncbi:PssD/Cps14F family polysaccharide biosynthesis glycosyltransferase [Aeromonas sp. QDB66]|uniref:PssD/Cps14F family polysaccharide biosynthesis glycosyltransferase n=1 Tax=Aeromonas sp. QDB66 TaxID=2989824 RepID=UPI0022E01A50|nr:PssD/Cps14F family polysaccharide biosynthesis glycosyltransferase [Aeromonas sp. QDB66]
MHLNKSILFCYGKGGHEAQINRLSTLLLPNLNDFNIVSISDSTRAPSWSHEHILTKEVRDKYNKSLFLTIKDNMQILFRLFLLTKSNDFSALISTGPGISVVAAIIFKLRGIKVIHIETWSRFHTRSLTGRCMYFLSDIFYVQHKSLLNYYPRAIYSGLL